MYSLLLIFVNLFFSFFRAVAASSLHSQHLGLTTAVAIGLHNIPEGIAISIPCLAARPDSPWLAFGLASLSGMTEPMGALVALTVLQVDAKSMGNWLSFVASIMISVAVWELFPEAWRNAMADDAKNAFWVGTALGFIIMVGSEAILNESL
jgi:ZIP family zinc transporter